MEAKRKRHIREGTEYNHLFPKPGSDTKTIQKNANVRHTVDFITRVVGQTLDHTRRIAQQLKGKTIYETCSNIWHFVYRHIHYKKDQDGYEQVRSPARTWHDRKQGVDCDCYSVFISSILANLGIAHILRITKYHRDYFQHIYPIVPSGHGNIIMDCVTDEFDYEVPFSEKKDYPMDLQYLNGFDGDSLPDRQAGMDELGRIIKKNMAKKPLLKTTAPATVRKVAPSFLQKLKAKKTAATLLQPAPGSSPSIPPVKADSARPAKQKKGVFKKVLNVVNKVNPATVLLRNGVLAAMKLNIKNVAKRLRWSYLSPEQAAAKNIDPVKFQKLVATRQKLEKIFYGAGGKPENLKKAILGGKGNKDKAISGLGMLPMTAYADYMNAQTPLEQLLGAEVDYSENVEGMEGFNGFGELGEPVTLTTVAAAMGVIAGIVASLKQIGDIFKSKTKESEDFDERKTDSPENSVAVPSITAATSVPSTASNPIVPTNNVQNTVPVNPDDDPSMVMQPVVKASENLPPAATKEEAATMEQKESNAVETDIEKNSSNKDTPDAKQSFWDKNKSWLRPVAVGAGGLTLIAIGYKMFGGSKAQNKSSPPERNLSGAPIPKKQKKKKHPRKAAKKNQDSRRAVAIV